MYLEHFNLQKPPFSLTPNTQFFCNLPGHQEALNVLLFSINSGEGFMKITGEVGSGKTLLCRKLLSELDSSFITAYIPNPDLDADGVRRSFAKELKIRGVSTISQVDLVDLIYKKLVKLRKDGKHVVLIVDEAQALPDKSLEALRLLTNLETESEKLLQIVLFGQPELDLRLSQHNFRQLNQRITFSHKLLPLGRSDMQEYLCHRLVTAGHTKGSMFDKKSCDMLFQVSGGTPRIINILCHKAMLSAYGRGDKMIGKKAMLAAINDSSELAKTVFKSNKKNMVGLLSGVIVICVFAIAYIEYFQVMGK
jgi:MSHA biogenesis protein MshM